MGAVGSENNAFFVALVLVIGGHHHDAGQFAMCSGHRLHGKGAHAANFAQEHVHFVDYFQCPLREHAAAAKLGQKRMQMCKAGVVCDALADLGIVFHCAGAEGIEIRVYAEVPARQLGKMPDHVQFAQFRQVCNFIPQ